MYIGQLLKLTSPHPLNCLHCSDWLRVCWLIAGKHRYWSQALQPINTYKTVKTPPPRRRRRHHVNNFNNGDSNNKCIMLNSDSNSYQQQRQDFPSHKVMQLTMGTTMATLAKPAMSKVSTTISWSSSSRWPLKIRKIWRTDKFAATSRIQSVFLHKWAPRLSVAAELAGTDRKRTAGATCSIVMPWLGTWTLQISKLTQTIFRKCK